MRQRHATCAVSGRGRPAFRGGARRRQPRHALDVSWQLVGSRARTRLPELEPEPEPEPEPELDCWSRWQQQSFPACGGRLRGFERLAGPRPARSLIFFPLHPCCLLNLPSVLVGGTGAGARSVQRMYSWSQSTPTAPTLAPRDFAARQVSPR
jgi:hypothetical protein